MEKILKFPKGFLWGSSTSAYQVEGGIKNCDWSKFKDAGIACDHYNRYEEDFDLLKKLNQNAFRLSIEWSRIEPEEGKFNENEIEHYKKVLLALKQRNIKSLVTLWHYTIPFWLAEIGGWSNKKAVDYFSRYTKIIVEELGDLIDFWSTLNEPMVYIARGYFLGNYPPQKKNIFEVKKVFDNLIKAHQKSYKIIHSQYQEAQVGINAIINFFEPARKWCLPDRFTTFLFHYCWNDWFFKKIKAQHYIDYIGLDYYFHNRMVFYPPFVRNLKKITSDIDWEVYPEGIYWTLKYLAKFRKPIYVTENGLADAKDRLRKDFIKEHLYWIHKALEEGVDVRGYLHWSLMDNFEWDKGFKPRFGLVEIDYKTLERKPRPSAFYYAQICKNNSLLY